MLIDRAKGAGLFLDEPMSCQNTIAPSVKVITFKEIT